VQSQPGKKGLKGLGPSRCRRARLSQLGKGKTCAPVLRAIRLSPSNLKHPICVSHQGEMEALGGTTTLGNHISEQVKIGSFMKEDPFPTVVRLGFYARTKRG